MLHSGYDHRPAAQRSSSLHYRIDTHPNCERLWWETPYNRAWRLNPGQSDPKQTQEPIVMILPRLSASRSKAEFFQHLGLLDSNEDHRQLYREMMSEAALGRQRTCEDPNNLTPQAQANPNLAPPYSSSMITEAAKHREVMNIWGNASPRTRPIYEMGRYQDGVTTDNWIIRWCLWHVFRYRDDRNRNRGHSSALSFYPVSQQATSEGDSDGDQAQGSAPTSPTTGTSTFYDPVRDRSR